MIQLPLFFGKKPKGNEMLKNISFYYLKKVELNYMEKLFLENYFQ